MNGKITNDNIVYVEPNWEYSDVKNGITYEMTPPLERYCVVVDLEVVVSERKQSNVTAEKKTFLFSYKTNKGNSSSNDSVTFFSGSRTANNTFSKEHMYLTSTPTTFGTFEDVKRMGTNECFGVRSIDIQYNNYSVPEVTIEFTDIRGISLFSQSELSHGYVNENGITGMVDYTDDVASSFFQCFFIELKVYAVKFQ